MSAGWILGAYAGNASLGEATREAEDRWWGGLRELPHVKGLELPFYADIHAQDPLGLVNRLPLDWEYAVTPLPGTMNLLGRNPGIGLAAQDKDLRKVALDRYVLVRERIDAIHQRAGAAIVRAVQVHSAPTRPYARPDAFQASLETLLEWDFGGAELWIEHCDAYAADKTFSKGFFTLDEEREVAARVKHPKLKFALNWGRSAVEARDADEPLRQLEQLGDRVGGFLFSGTAADDPLYGAWQDNHAPLATGSRLPWEPTRGLMTKDRVAAILQNIPKDSPLQLGIKVQPAPSSLTLPQRLDFLKQQLEAFESLRV